MIALLLAAAPPSVEPTTGADGAGAAVIDPTLLAILSIFGGAALTAAAGFWGAWRQSKREHERWVREHRYQVYLDNVRTLRAVIMNHKEATGAATKAAAFTGTLDALKAEVEAGASDERLDEISAEVKSVRAEIARHAANQQKAQKATVQLIEGAVDRAAPFFLLGPKNVSVAASKVASALGENADDSLEALTELERAMRSALNIDDFETGR